MDKADMEGLRELSKIYLKIAERNDDNEWTKRVAQEPVVQHKPRVTFSDNVTVIHDRPKPKRAAREVANLDPTTILGNNESPARNTRARFAVAAAALTAIVSSNQANAEQWEHRKHNPTTHKLELNELACAVLEGDKMLNYRQLDTPPGNWGAVEAFLFK